MSTIELKITKKPKEKNNEIELEIEAPKDVSNKAYSIALKKISNEVDTPGFRKGKAPRDIIEKTYGVAFISQKAFENIFYDLLLNAAIQEKLDIVDVVEVSSFELLPEKPLLFKAIVELRPEVKLGKYKNLKVKAKKMIYDKNAFTKKTLEKISNNLITFQSANDRAVKEGDLVDINFEGRFDDGSEVPGGKVENFQAVLEKDKFLPEFVDKLKGAKVGETKEVTVTFPESYDKGFAGKKGLFKVKLNAIEEKIVPKVNDDLAKKVGLNDLEELKKRIESQMLELQETNNKNEFENKLVEEIIKNSKMNISERMIEKEIDFLLADAREQSQKNGVSWDKFKADNKNKEIMEKAKEAAVKRISIDLVLNEAIKQEKIDLTQEEVDKEVKIRIAQAGEQYKKFENDSRFVNSIRLTLLRNKALDLLSKNNEPVWEEEATMVGPDS